MATSGSRFQLDEDYDAGFKQAVSNNQSSLALHYLLVKLEKMEEEIAELKAEKKTAAPAPKPAAKKATKKTTAASKSDDDKKDDKDE